MESPNTQVKGPKQAQVSATPAINKRRQATRDLIVQSPTDRIFSPISRRLLKRKTVIKPIGQEGDEPEPDEPGADEPEEDEPVAEPSD